MGCHAKVSVDLDLNEPMALNLCLVDSCNYSPKITRFCANLIRECIVFSLLFSLSFAHFIPYAFSPLTFPVQPGSGGFCATRLGCRTKSN